MTLYDKIQSWDVETLAEFIVSIMETTESELAKRAHHHLPENYCVSLLQIPYEIRVAMTVQDLMKDYDETSV